MTLPWWFTPALITALIAGGIVYLLQFEKDRLWVALVIWPLLRLTGEVLAAVWIAFPLFAWALG